MRIVEQINEINEINQFNEIYQLNNFEKYIHSGLFDLFVRIEIVIYNIYTSDNT